MSAGPYTFFGLILFHCQGHFLGRLSSVSFLSPLQVFTSPPLPAHAASPKPQTKTPCFPLVEEAFPLPPAACILPCQPREASSLRSLSIPSLRETNTCGLGYQYFNFYQYGVWLVVIHGFRSPQSVRRLPACSCCPVCPLFFLLMAIIICHKLSVNRNQSHQPIVP